MRSFVYAATALAAVATAAPASAAIVVLANSIDLSVSGPITVGLDTVNTFTFSFDPIAPFDPDPTLVQTSGNAATTSFGGFLGIPLEPSTFFVRSDVAIGPGTFPGFNSFPDATRIPFSLSPGDLGLRVTIGGQDFFGVARVTGANVTVAFNDVAGESIRASAAIPEPATWAMLILGFGAVGGAMRMRVTKTKAVLA